MLVADTSPRGSNKQNAESTTGRIGDDVQRAKENISDAAASARDDIAADLRRLSADVTSLKDTVAALAGRYCWEFAAFNAFSVIVFTVEYALRIWSAVEIPMLSRLPRWQARLRYAMRPMMIIDLLAFLPWYLHWLYPLDLRLLRVFRLCRLLMLVRYSPALQTLGRSFGGLLVILILLLFASSGMYLIERHMQPNKFGSIPQAAW